MPVIYMQTDYEEYKYVEHQMREFKETLHTSTNGFYHKSIRLHIGDHLTLEIHGPLVKAGSG